MNCISTKFQEVGESGRPLLFWKQKIAGSNPAFLTLAVERFAPAQFVGYRGYGRNGVPLVLKTSAPLNNRMGVRFLYPLPKFV